MNNPHIQSMSEIGMVGLGVMGRNLVLNIADHGFAVAGYDQDPAKVAELRRESGERAICAATNTADFIALLRPPRAIMLLVPAGAAVDSVIHELVPLLGPGDLIIDAGNSWFKDTDLRAKTLAAAGLHFLGVGVSGGEAGARHGPSLMPGGPKSAYERVRPVFEAVAARIQGEPCVTWLGPGSSGHFVKMVHNGIEYGIMAAYAEGLGVLNAANIGKGQSASDAETTPLRDPEHYQYDIKLADVAEVWRRGSVIASWLLDLTATALAADPKLSKFAGRVSDSGEGRWTIKAAIDEGVPVPVLTTALYERFASRGESDYQDKLLSAMRFGFGGHLEKTEAKKP
jgi:6-phosphogluconate dehydrogenase